MEKPENKLTINDEETVLCMETNVCLLAVELPCDKNACSWRGPRRGLVFPTLDLQCFRFLPRYASLTAPNLTPELPADKDILNNVIVRDDFLVETSALSCGHPLIDSKQRVI